MLEYKGKMRMLATKDKQVVDLNLNHLNNSAVNHPSDSIASTLLKVIGLSGALYTLCQLAIPDEIDEPVKPLSTSDIPRMTVAEYKKHNKYIKNEPLTVPLNINNQPIYDTTLYDAKVGEPGVVQPITNKPIPSKQMDVLAPSAETLKKLTFSEIMNIYYYILHHNPQNNTYHILTRDKTGKVHLFVYLLGINKVPLLDIHYIPSSTFDIENNQDAICKLVEQSVTRLTEIYDAANN